MWGGVYSATAQWSHLLPSVVKIVSKSKTVVNITGNNMTALLEYFNTLLTFKIHIYCNIIYTV